MIVIKYGAGRKTLEMSGNTYDLRAATAVVFNALVASLKRRVEAPKRRKTK